MPESVITHGYTDGTQLSVCEFHSAPNFSDAGASYSGVSHGEHIGQCDVCAATPPAAWYIVWDRPSGHQPTRIEAHTTDEALRLAARPVAETRGQDSLGGCMPHQAWLIPEVAMPTVEALEHAYDAAYRDWYIMADIYGIFPATPKVQVADEVKRLTWAAYRAGIAAAAVATLSS